MTQEQIIEKNKLIAEFMGAKMIVEDYYGINIIKFPDESTKDLNGLKYHSSWEWLMDAVDKIQILRERFNNPKLEYGLTLINAMDRWLYVQHKSLSKKEAVWLAVVEFIKWYNTNENNY